MAFICIFVPAVIMCGVRRILLESYEHKGCPGWLMAVFEYASCCLFLNLLLYACLALFWQITQDIYGMLGADSLFAMKYLLSSVAFAVAVPFFEKYLRENFAFSVKAGGSLASENQSAVSRWICRYGVYAIGIVAIGMHFIRIFDNVFWYDEILPLFTRTMRIRDMLHQVAAWGHTPLHYAIILVLYRMFGSHGAIYHFVSLFPYIVIIIASMTHVRKWFGKRAAIILILLSSLLSNAVQYNVEVRMYSWCQMFIFLAYLAMYHAMRTRKTRHYALMSAFSIGALYSHYFAVAAIGILYLVLLAYNVRNDKKCIWKVICSGATAIMLFLPWMLYGHHVRGQFVAQYGIPETSWRSCLEYIFSSKHSMFLLIMFAAIFLLVFLRDTGIMKVMGSHNQKKSLVLNTNPKDWRLSYQMAWLCAGVVATFGTIIAAEWFSHTFYPIITVRYLYPSFILVWLTFGISISSCKRKKMLSWALSLILLISCVPSYLTTVKNERSNASIMENTLATTSEIGTGDYIMTNIGHLDWDVIDYYYQGTSHNLFSESELPEFHGQETNWLFLDNQASGEIMQVVTDRGYSMEQVVAEGYVGTYKIWIYRLVNG